MALILANYVNPLPILDGYRNDLLGVLPEYRSEKSLNTKIIDTDVVKVERNGNAVLITFNLPHLKSSTFTINSSLFKARTRFVAFVNRQGDFVVEEFSNLIKDRQTYDKLRLLKHTSGGSFVEFYFHDSATEGLISIKKLCVSNEEFVVVDRNKSFTTLVVETFPEMSSLITSDRNKLDVLYNLNPIDSVVALEQQVDLLTTLVKNLINDQSQPSWSSDFLSKTEASSVTTLRSVNDIITDIDNAKKKIRAAQKTYLDNK
jgi:hypothetical protein